MTKYILALTLTMIASGCSLTTKPKNDLGFAEVHGLAQFNGCYENCSDTADGSALTCLSNKIWPDHFTQENRPDEIYVESKSNVEIAVTAFKLGNKIKESLFKEGEHFTFKHGRIELKRETIASGASEPGNPFIGIATGKTILGIDASGEGRVEQSTSFVGTGFLIIPVAGSGTDVSKIKRKGPVCSGD